MSQFRFETRWLEAPAAVTGPDAALWGELTVTLAEECVTAHHKRDRRVAGEDHRAVQGTLSGVADWIVSQWPALAWESYAPVSRPAGWRGGAVYPTADDSWHDYAAWTDDDDQVTAIVEWHERHLCGSLASNLALPSLVLVPEPPYYLVEVADAAEAAGSSVEFHAPPGSTAAWPRLCTLPYDTVLSELARFVQTCVERCAGQPAVAHWAAWMADRFEQAQRDAADPGQQMQWQYGPLIADHLAALPPGEARQTAAAGLFRDTAPAENAATARQTQDWIDDVVARAASSAARWSGNGLPFDLQQQPFEQGYLLAQDLRRRLRNPDRPIDLDDVCFELDVELHREPAATTIETAVVGVPGRRAWLLSNTTSQEQRLQHQNGRRFAEAAALGRLLAAAGETAGHAVGAALGKHSLPVAGRRARAFAAELLLPADVAREHSRGDDLADLATLFGVSPIAAQWHVHNVTTIAG